MCAKFVISVDTRYAGTPHAKELEGMDYRFTVGIPQEVIVPPGHTKPEPDPLLDLVFHEAVPIGQVIARFIFRATGEQWGKVASEFKDLWKDILGEDLTEEHEEQLIPIFGILLAPPRTETQDELLSKCPDGMERFKELAQSAHDWAKRMAMRAVEAWHSTQIKANSHNPEG
jgi:hypothetical protein